jgi:hypothetical protein
MTNTKLRKIVHQYGVSATIHGISISCRMLTRIALLNTLLPLSSAALLYLTDSQVLRMRELCGMVLFYRN